MIKTYKDFNETNFNIELTKHDISKYNVLFHMTLKSRRKSIEQKGLKTFQPQHKSLIQTDLIFVSYPVNMDTGDCFRWSDKHYSLIVLDAVALQKEGYVFYDDPFGQEDRSSLRNHLCIDKDIPKEFIKKVIEFNN